MAWYKRRKGKQDEQNSGKNEDITGLYRIVESKSKIIFRCHDFSSRYYFSFRFQSSKKTLRYLDTT